MGTAKRMPGMQYTESYPPLEQLYHRCSCSLAPNAERIRYGHQQARPGVPHCGIYVSLWLPARCAEHVPNHRSSILTWTLCGWTTQGSSGAILML